MQAEAGENINSGRRVRSRKKWNPRPVHRIHHFQFFFHEAFSGGEIVRAETMRDLLGESLPRDIFPICGRVLGARVVRELCLVDQVAAPLPHQGGTLPGMILRQQRKQRRRPLGIIR